MRDYPAVTLHPDFPGRRGPLYGEGHLSPVRRQGDAVMLERSIGHRFMIRHIIRTGSKDT